MGIFSKTNTYNEKLERILENKTYTQTVKNLLQDVLYKIEISYLDYAEVKVDSLYKENIIEKFLYIVDKELDVVKLITPQTIEAKILEYKNVNYIVEVETKSIICYANEKDLFSAILELDERISYKKSREEKYEINYHLVDLDYMINSINRLFIKGSVQDEVDILRDYTGWAWTPNKDEVDDIIINTIYQDLLVLCGLSNVKRATDEFKKSGFEQSLIEESEIEENTKTINSFNIGFINIHSVEDKEEKEKRLLEENKAKQEKEEKRKKLLTNDLLRQEETEKYITSYKETIEKLLKKKFTKIECYNLLKKINTLLVLDAYKNDEVIKKQIDARENELNKQIDLMSDNSKFINFVNQNRQIVNQKIRELDYILSSRENLEQELSRRNKNLPNDKKIFGPNALEKIIRKEKEEYIYRLLKYSKMCDQNVFIEERDKAIKEANMISDAKGLIREERETSLLVELQKEVLRVFLKQVESAQTKNEMVDLIYKYRFLNFLPITKVHYAKDIYAYQEEGENVLNTLIDRAIYKKVIENISDSKSLCYKIFNPIMNCRIIALNDIEIKISIKEEIQVGPNKKDKEYIINEVMFDQSEEEVATEIKIPNMDMLKLRANRKIKLFL